MVTLSRSLLMTMMTNREMNVRLIKRIRRCTDFCFCFAVRRVN